MPLLILLLLVLPLSNPVSSEQSGLQENVKDDLEETMYKMDDIENKVVDLENKLETKNVEVESLQKQVKGMKMQFAEIESRVEEVMVSSQKKQEIASLKMQVTEIESKVEDVASLKSEMRAEVKKELDNVLPMAVEQGVRDLPFEMVCTYQHQCIKASNSIINYNRITVEFNNSHRPGGADGSMNIETGVFTTITSGYYIITYSAYVLVYSGKYHTVMYLHHNGVQVEESRFYSSIQMGSGDNYIFEQGSRTVILHLLAGDTLDLRTKDNSNSICRITMCLYMAPAPYGL